MERRVHGLEAGAAQPVHRLPGDLDGEARQQRRHPGHVAVVLARLVRAAEDHVVHECGIDARPLDQCAQRDRGQVVRPDRGERAPVPPDRRPDGVDDPRLHGLAHFVRSQGAAQRARSLTIQFKSTHTLLTCVYRSSAYAPSSRP